METLSNHLIQATGWSIIHSLWQGALIYALVLPFHQNLIKLSAKFKYNLAYAAHLLMLVCFGATFYSIFSWPSDKAVLTALSNAGDQSVSYGVSIPRLVAKYAELLFPYLVLLYGAGFVIQCIIVVQGYRKIQQLKHAVYSNIPEDWRGLFDRLVQGMRINRDIDFRISDRVNVPLVIGFFKPVILFPLALVNQMDLNQVEAILIHELSHIRRNDYLFNLLKTVVDTILFFNPFVWLNSKLIQIEREHACDDMVVKTTHTPLTYAHALLTLELLTDKSSPAFSLAATGSEQHLYQRIKRITDMKTNYSNSKQKLVAITLTIATIVSLAWISPAKDEKSLKKSAIQRNRPMVILTDINPLDTGKKKHKKIVKIKAVIPAPLPPAEPLAPPVPENTELPEPPEAPEMDITGPFTVSLSNSLSNFAIKVKDLAMSGYSSDAEIKKMQADIEKQGIELQRQFDSPEQKAKWEKYGKDMEAKFNSPEQKAKWEKYSKDLEAKFNSPEEKAKWEKYGKEMEARFNSPEARAKWEKMAKENQARYNSAEERQKYIKLQNDMRIHMGKSLSFQKNASAFAQKVKKVQQSQEYQELKKKYDRDLEELYKKKLNEDQK
jgi:bla regulator protein BlaR1